MINLANAKRCDRCGNYYEIKNATDYNGVNLILENRERHFDLCEKCLDKTKAFLKVDTKKETEK